MTNAAHRFWLGLVQAHRVMVPLRAGFVGKASPVPFFWGGPDVATTRCSGRPAPKRPGAVPDCPDWVQEMACWDRAAVEVAPPLAQP